MDTIKRTEARLLDVRELSRGYNEENGETWPHVDVGRTPILVHGVGVYYRRFFDPGVDYFRRICAEHAFQSLTESTKPETSHRTGIYLTPVERDDGELHFRLLRCSTNLSGPTENFRANDRHIVDALNQEAAFLFQNQARLNHVLAQVCRNTPATAEQRQSKARISTHADKTATPCLSETVSSRSSTLRLGSTTWARAGRELCWRSSTRRRAFRSYAPPPDATPRCNVSKQRMSDWRSRFKKARRFRWSSITLCSNATPTRTPPWAATPTRLWIWQTARSSPSSPATSTRSWRPRLGSCSSNRSSPEAIRSRSPWPTTAFVVFSVATNRRFKHRIVLEASAQTPENQWLGITFRTSKTYVRLRDGQGLFSRRHSAYVGRL